MLATTRTGITAPHRVLFAAALAVWLGVAMLGVATAATTAPARTSAPDSTRAGRPAARTGVVRTLEAINIEGEIAVPQVLFITARDVRRYRDGMGLKFQLNAIEAGRSTVLPSRLRVVQQPWSYKEEGK